MTPRLPVHLAAFAAICAAVPTAAQADSSHIGRSSDGTGPYPDPGYVWSNTDSEGRVLSLDVNWQPGVPYWKYGKLKWAHILAASEEGRWRVAPGYTWSHRDGDGRPIDDDLTVEWKPGASYYKLSESSWPHVHATEREECWRPDPGYVWTDEGSELSHRWALYLQEIQDSKDVAHWSEPPFDAWRGRQQTVSWAAKDADLAVAWQPGLPHDRPGLAKWPHVITDKKEGEWHPAPGYTWSHKDADGRPINHDMTVEWDPGASYWYLGEIAFPNIRAAGLEGDWEPARGFVWVAVDAQGRPLTLAVRPTFNARIMDTASRHWVVTALAWFAVVALSGAILDFLGWSWKRITRGTR